MGSCLKVKVALSMRGRTRDHPKPSARGVFGSDPALLHLFGLAPMYLEVHG